MLLLSLWLLWRRLLPWNQLLQMLQLRRLNQWLLWLLLHQLNVLLH